ncbi:MAG: hypothetical protein ACTSRW_16040 [Candidatus Helarchaeota archaeon]
MSVRLKKSTKERLNKFLGRILVESGKKESFDFAIKLLLDSQEELEKIRQGFWKRLREELAQEVSV